MPQLRLLWRVLIAAAPALAATLGAAATDTSSWVEIRGRVRCVETEAASFAPGDSPCDAPGARFEFDTSDGRTFTLRPDDPKAEAFLDPVVRSRELSLRGWPRGEAEFEILSVFSWKDGQAHHVHFRCDVCDITSSAPGPCWCCGEDFELREEPVDAERN